MRLLGLSFLLGALACGGRVTPPGDTGTSNDSGSVDRTPGNPTPAIDSGDVPEATVEDAGIPVDLDAAAPDDATTVVDATCGVPPTLHLNQPGTLFCGFGAEAGTLLCSTGQECCLGGSLGGGTYAPEECAAFGATCTNGSQGSAIPPIPIMCNQVADCVANGVADAGGCCLQGATEAIDPNCNYPRARQGTAIACEPSGCAAGEISVCSVQSDCPSGTTCTAAKWKIFQIGLCL